MRIRRYLFTLILIFSLFGISEARDVIDGYDSDNFEITQWDGIAAPSVAPANSSRIYYDQTLDYTLLSENGGIYSRLMTLGSLPTESDPLSWLKATAQTGLTGDKTGQFNLNIGTGTLGAGNVTALGLNATDTTNYNFRYPATVDYHRYTFDLISNPSSYSNVYSKNSATATTQTLASWAGSEISTTYYQGVADPSSAVVGDSNAMEQSTGEFSNGYAGFLMHWKTNEKTAQQSKLTVYARGLMTDGWTLAIWDFTNLTWDTLATTALSTEVALSATTTNITDYVNSTGDVYVLAYTNEAFDDTFYIYYTYLDVYANKEIRNEAHYGDLQVYGSLKLVAPYTFGGPSNRISGYFGQMAIADPSSTAGFYPNYLQTLTTSGNGSGIYLTQAGSAAYTGLRLIQESSTSTTPIAIDISQGYSSATGNVYTGIRLNQGFGISGGFENTGFGVNASAVASDYTAFSSGAHSFKTGVTNKSITAFGVAGAAAGDGLKWGYWNGTALYHNFMAIDNGISYFGTGKDAGLSFSGTQFLARSDYITSTDSFQLRGGTNGILFNIGATQYLALTANTLTFADATNIVLNATTGTKIGTATTQKLGFYNVTPIVQPSAYTQTYSTASKTNPNITTTAVNTTGSTQVTPYGYATSAQADSIPVQINALQADLLAHKKLLNALIDDLQALGLAG